MNKKRVQAACYALAAALACIISANGIIPSGSKKEAVSKESDALSVSSAGLTASAGSIHVDEPPIATPDHAAFDGKPQITTSDNAAFDGESQITTSDNAVFDSQKNSGKASKKETNGKAAEKESGDKVSETAADDEGAETAADNEIAEPGVEKTGPYYIYRVTMDPQSLNMYSDPEIKNQIASVPSGYHGYVIKKLDGYRSLVLFQGKVGYCSNMYLEMTEIPPEEYPDELVGLSEEDVGETLFDGAAVGTAEGSN